MNSEQKNYNKTMYACFIAYFVGAIVNCFAPLLFVTFQTDFNIPLSSITLIASLNFLVQLVVDLVCAGVVDKIGYRPCLITAHVFCALGVIGLATLPFLFSNAFIGLLISMLFYAVGGGLLEVLVSPLVEACPSKNKARAMSLLHSFFCWGVVVMVLVSSAFFLIFGIENWRYLCLFWAVVPIINIVLFSIVPIYKLRKEDEEKPKTTTILKKWRFWVLVLMMACAGASETSISQWASTLAETSFGVNKILGDMLGILMFSVFMGLSRAIFAKFGEKINLDKFMIFCSALCVVCFLGISLIPSAVVGLICCALSGFGVGILWPGTISITSAKLKGGTAMFAFLAVGGDIGAATGPAITGFISSAFNGDFRIGILFSLVFPLLMLLLVILNSKKTNKSLYEKK